MGRSGVLQEQDRAIQKNRPADLRSEKSGHENEVSFTNETPELTHIPQGRRNEFHSLNMIQFFILFNYQKVVFESYESVIHLW